MYDDASLTCQQVLGGTTVESSLATGWRSVLVERSRWAAGDWNLRTHPTTDVRLCLALRGSHRVEVLADRGWLAADVAAGDVAMTDANEVDSIRWNSDIPFEAASMFVPGFVLDAAGEELRRPGGPTPRLLDLAADDAVVTSTMQALISGMRSGAPDLYAEQAAHWLAMHLLVRQERFDQGVGRADRIVDRRLQRAIDMIENRYAEPLTLEQLAAEACVSRFHFARLFKRQTGMAPHAYLQAERLRASRSLLVKTDLAVAEVAHRTGFSTASHFAVAFKAANGLGPAAFRRERRERKG